MSPEQIRKSREIDGRTDIFSLAAILYEALSGRTPNSGDTVDSLISSTLNDAPKNISDISNLRLPLLIDELIMKCLSKDADDRVLTIDEFIRLLKQ